MPACLILNYLLNFNLQMRQGSHLHGDEDIIGFSNDLDALGGNITENSDRDTRPREWMAHDQSFWDPQFSTEPSHFVLETVDDNFSTHRE